MKRKRFILMATVVVIAILCIIGFLLFMSNPNVVKAQLIIESGNVQIKHTGESWKPAQNGMILYQSDSVKTGNNTSAAVVLFESSIIRLDSNTEVTINKIIKQGEETSIKINQDTGRTWNTVLKISGIDNYDVQTPTTVAGTRGTSFVVNIHADGKTDVGVVHGTIIVSSIQNGQVIYTIEVNKDESVTIDPDAIDQPLEIKPFEKDEWILKNEQKDEDIMENIKDELYKRIEPYIPELKDLYGVTDKELDIIIDGYIQGYYDLPPETPDWIREIIELS